MLWLDAHGKAVLEDARTLSAEYQTSDRGPGHLTLRLEDPRTYDEVVGRVRLDPWRAGEYCVLELSHGAVLVICGAQAIVVLDAASLTITASVALEYEETETMNAPWHTESHTHRAAILATERRVWCLSDQGCIRWMWSCAMAEEKRWLSSAPTLADSHVRIPLGSQRGHALVELDLHDGLPNEDLRFS